VNDMEAIWYPFWYECDQAIAVGQVAVFDFFKTPPDYVAHEGKRVFYHGSYGKDHQHLFEAIRLRILSVRHPQLGSIEAIDTKGLDYTFLMEDGRILEVNAEEEPGRVFESPAPVDDWLIYVQAEIL